MKLNKTFFASLLRRKKQEKITNDSIFLEWDFNGVYLYVFATKENEFEIKEICIDDEIKLTKEQLKDLQTLVYQKRLGDPINMEDYHPQRPI